MRIGIDARELSGHATGVGRYLSGLLRQWAVSADAMDHEFVLYATEPLASPFDGRRFTTRVVAGRGGTWWEQVRLPLAVADDRLDVFFSPGYTTALRFTIPVVVAIHDVSFIAHPEWFGVREGVRRRWLTTQSAAKARTILTISEVTRRELVERLNIPGDRIQVIPPGVSVEPPGTGPRSGVLYVGSIFNRRHVPDLVRGFAAVARAHPTLTLDLVGDNRSHPHEDLLGLIAREGLVGRAHWRAFLSDDALRALYGSARAFAFLSEYEGLGLTPLEALAAGIPAVLLDTPVARESCGSAALYVQRDDVDGVAHALRALLFHEPTRQQLLAAAPRVLARYSWAEAARDTLAALERGGRA